MEKINSPKEFAALIKDYKKNHKKVLSNCFFLPDEVEYMTKQQKLFVESREDLLCFYTEEADCWRLYYYMEAGMPVAIEKKDKPLILDYVFRGEEEEKLRASGSESWIRAGFAPYKRYRRMECAGEAFCPPVDQEEKLSAYPMEFLKETDYHTVQKLWRESLDVYSTLLPEREEFTEFCQKGQLLGMRLSDGEAGAVIIAIPKGRTGFLQHLVVSPEFRGLGMGRTLFCKATEHLLAEEKTQKVNFWVDEENIHAIEIYKRMGYVYDGFISRQFKLEKEH